MAIRYVKDFEFPAAAGYSKSQPGKVTGQMFAKGGKVNSVPVKDIKSGKVPQSTDEDFYGKAKDAPMPPRRPSMMKKGGYAEGGEAVKVPLPAEEEAPYPVQWPMPSDEQMNKENWNQRKAIRRAMGAKNTGKDTFAKGGMKHDDAAQDKKMIKSMVKPDALKKAGGGMAQKVQMAKSDAIEGSLKGQKKTPYAVGGPATGVMARPFGSGARQTDPSMSSTVPKKAGGVIKKADGGNVMPPRIASPLQAMAARPRGVPVAPRAPMIAPQAVPAMNQAAAPGGARIGVGRSRPGQPDVGAIRAAMARSASQAMPENAPSMMKKGGKVKC